MNDRCGAKCPQLPKVLYAAEGQQIFSFVFFGFADLADAKKIQRQCLWEWPMPGDDGGIPTRTCGMDGYLQLLTEEYTRYGVQMMPLVAGIMLVWVGYLKRIRISGPVPEASSI